MTITTIMMTIIISVPPRYIIQQQHFGMYIRSYVQTLIVILMYVLRKYVTNMAMFHMKHHPYIRT